MSDLVGLPPDPITTRKGQPPHHFADLAPGERAEAVSGLGLPAFRAKQISNHYYAGFSVDPLSWSDLPAAHRQTIKDALFPDLITRAREVSCDGGATAKTLWRLHDGTLVESVLMRYGMRRDGTPGSHGVRSTLCVSSQAGCGMGCPFCATGQSGLQRNLSTAEIVDQVRAACADLAKGELPGGTGRLNNVVFMGMGEPLANFNAVMRAIRAITAPAPDGLGISARGLTVSTVGLVPRIEQLADAGIPVTLAVSLHAPDDELRDTLVPINTRYKVGEVIDAAWRYADRTKRRVSIEYALIKDINDQAWRADRLAKLLHARGDWGWVHVNLIPLNPTPGSVWTASRPGDQADFERRLAEHGVPVTVRDTRGREIDGACGQLAAIERGR